MFEESIHQSGFWTECGPYSHIVLSSRLRLARNMQSVMFPNMLDAGGAYPIKEAIRHFAAESSFRDNTILIDLADIDSNEKRYLRERNIITYEMEVSDLSMVAVNGADDFSILVNEEDHFRIQVIRPGLQLMEAYKVADKVDTELNKFIDYAFSDELGYLSACTSNVGTGLRVSALLHLPNITTNQKIHDIIPESKKRLIQIKGTIGNSNKTLGSLYHLSNRVTLGLSEIDIIEVLDDVLGSILELEDNARDECISRNRLEMEDRIMRSYGMLRFSRKMSYLEAMEHLSNVRLGVILAVIKNLELKDVNDLMVNVQWAHLQKAFDVIFTSTGEADSFRAEYLSCNLKSAEVK